MKTAVVLVALFGACMAQVYHVSQPAIAVHSVQPVAVHSVQPVLSVRSSEQLRKPIAILRQSGDLKEDGSFQYDFESENGISASAQGSQRALGPDTLAQSVQGSYSYTAPDGTPITIQYIADENGFQAQGAAIPTPPPIPAEIQKSLALLPTLEEFERQEAARQAKYQQRRA